MARSSSGLRQSTSPREHRRDGFRIEGLAALVDVARRRQLGRNLPQAPLPALRPLAPQTARQGNGIGLQLGEALAAFTLAGGLPLALPRRRQLGDGSRFLELSDGAREKRSRAGNC